MESPSSCPGYQASTTAFTELSHGMVTAEPVLSTTTVLGLTWATAEISRVLGRGEVDVGKIFGLLLGLSDEHHSHRGDPLPRPPLRPGGLDRRRVRAASTPGSR